MKWIQRQLRSLLGLDDDLNQIILSIESANGDVQRIELMMRKHDSALGRIIAKLDPMYGKSEFDKDRIADSDKIGEMVMNKLWAEQDARNKHDAPPK